MDEDDSGGDCTGNPGALSRPDGVDADSTR
jgi:hypothetical protein